MLVYIAGKLTEESEKKFLEKLAKFCESRGLKTFLPHRDVGICKSLKDVKRIFRADITDSLDKSDLVIADLNGIHVGAGTAWELGYAFAKGIPVIGIKTDERIEDSLDSLSAILIASMKIVSSLEELDKQIKELTST